MFFFTSGRFRGTYSSVERYCLDKYCFCIYFVHIGHNTKAINTASSNVATISPIACSHKNGSQGCFEPKDSPDAGVLSVCIPDRPIGKTGHVRLGAVM